MADQPPNLPDLPTELLLQITSYVPTVTTTTTTPTTTKTKKTKNKQAKKGARTITSSTKAPIAKRGPRRSPLHTLTLLNRQLHSKLNPFFYHSAVRNPSLSCLPLIHPLAIPKRGQLRTLQLALLEGADVNQLCTFRESPCCACRVQGFDRASSASGSGSAQASSGPATGKVVGRAASTAGGASKAAPGEASKTAAAPRITPPPPRIPARLPGKTPASIARASSSASASAPPPPSPAARQSWRAASAAGAAASAAAAAGAAAAHAHSLLPDLTVIWIPITTAQASSSSTAPRTAPPPPPPPSPPPPSSPSGKIFAERHLPPPKSCCYLSLQTRRYDGRAGSLRERERLGRALELTPFQAALLAGEEGMVLQLMRAGADVGRRFECFAGENGGERGERDGPGDGIGDVGAGGMDELSVAYLDLRDSLRALPPAPVSPLEVLGGCSSCPIETARSVAGWYGMVEVLRRLEVRKRERREQEERKKRGREEIATDDERVILGLEKLTLKEEIHPFGFAAAAYLHFGSERAMETVRFFALETELEVENWEQMMFDALRKIRKTKPGQLQFDWDKVESEAWLWDTINEKGLMRVELRLKGSERELGEKLVRARWTELKEMFEKLRKEKEGAEIAVSKE